MSLCRKALIVLKAIEDAVALHDPYNNPFDGPATLSDCELPYYVEDPLELVRKVLGDDYASRLEHEDDLEHIAQTLQRCIVTELAARGQTIADLEAEGTDSAASDEEVADGCQASSSHGGGGDCAE